MPSSTPLVGRKAEIVALRGALDAARIVVVRGPAGVGKSRLVAEALPDAVFCSMTRAAGEGDALAALHEALGVTGPVALEVVLARLGRRASPVIVLDGCDRMSPELGDWLPGWLASHEEVRFVVTACAVSVLGAAEIDLPALDLADALALWNALMQRSPTAAGGEIATAIVERVDRLPLAIEWMALRAGLIGEAACLARLSSSSTDAGPLSVALTTAIDGLEPGERRALALLSTFERGATAAVLDRLLGAALPDVEALVRRALVRFDRSASGTSWTAPYRLVGLRMRRMAGASGTFDELQREHARAVLAVAEPLGQRDERPPAELLDLHDELLAIAERFETTDPDLALRASLAAAPIFLSERSASAGAERIRRILEGASPASGEAGLCLAALERRAGRFDRARAALEVGEASDFRVLLERAHLDRMQSRVADALAGYERALALAEQGGDGPRRCVALGELGRMLQSVGRFAAAQERHQVAAGLAHALGMASREALERSLFARATHRAGQVRQALALHEQALALHRRLTSPRLVAAELGHLAFCHHELGDVARAEELFRASVEGLYEVGDVMLECIERILLARLLTDADRHAEASLELGIVAEAIDGVDVPRIRATHALVVGLNELGRGRVAAARDRLAEAVRTADHVEVGFEALAPAYLALVEHHRGDASAALDALAVARARIAPVEAPGLHAAFAAIEAKVRGEPVVGASPEVLETSSDARRATRLATALPVDRPSSRPPGVLEVAPDGRALRLPRGDRIELGRQAAPRRILLALARARSDRPGTSLGYDELVTVGWPGERMLAEAARKRLRTAIWTLRKAGLEPVLLTRDDGYLLDPFVAFAWGSGGS